jgi:hypothetical protein
MTYNNVNIIQAQLNFIHFKINEEYNNYEYISIIISNVSKIFEYIRNIEYSNSLNIQNYIITNYLNLIKYINYSNIDFVKKMQWLNFGLNNNLITPNIYDSYIIDNINNKEDIKTKSNNLIDINNLRNELIIQNNKYLYFNFLWEDFLIEDNNISTTYLEKIVSFFCTTNNYIDILKNIENINIILTPQETQNLNYYLNKQLLFLKRVIVFNKGTNIYNYIIEIQKNNNIIIQKQIIEELYYLHNINDLF